MAERLCFYCIDKNIKSCEFVAKADLIATEAPIDADIEQAFRAHKSISFERVFARKQACPNVNYEPEYPGKKHL